MYIYVISLVNVVLLVPLHNNIAKNVVVLVRDANSHFIGETKCQFPFIHQIKQINRLQVTYVLLNKILVLIKKILFLFEHLT